jgi:LysR family transcriptional activator of nhaA
MANDELGGLNLHHLRYFRAVARDGNLTRAGRQLRVAPSALSAQIRQLEDHLGHALFAREGRGLVLTEAGALALAHADAIFARGVELVTTLGRGRRPDETLRIGAVATLSRNFQASLLGPLVAREGVQLSLTSGSLDELVARLGARDLDVVLSNRAVSGSPFRCRRLARQPVSVVSSRARRRFRFPEDLASQPMILPGPASDVRTGFEACLERLGVRVRVVAEVDDMATMRLLARDGAALALVPSVVVRDELRQGVVHELCVVPELFESFHAITVERTFPHPLVETLLGVDERALLAGVEAPRAPVTRRPPRR